MGWANNQYQAYFSLVVLLAENRPGVEARSYLEAEGGGTLKGDVYRQGTGYSFIAINDDHSYFNDVGNEAS